MRGNRHRVTLALANGHWRREPRCQRSRPPTDVAVKQLERKRRFRIWNVWIIYPVLGLGLIFGIDTWNTFGRKPITEHEIRREMDRLRGDR
jgi:hypothetical protein